MHLKRASCLRVKPSFPGRKDQEAIDYRDLGFWLSALSRSLTWLLVESRAYLIRLMANTLAQRER
jgi:hypothetical protein